MRCPSMINRARGLRRLPFFPLFPLIPLTLMTGVYCLLIANYKAGKRIEQKLDDLVQPPGATGTAAPMNESL